MYWFRLSEWLFTKRYFFFQGSVTQKLGKTFQLYSKEQKNPTVSPQRTLCWLKPKEHLVQGRLKDSDVQLVEDHTYLNFCHKMRLETND